MRKIFLFLFFMMTMFLSANTETKNENDLSKTNKFIIVLSNKSVSMELEEQVCSSAPNTLLLKQNENENEQDFYKRCTFFVLQLAEEKDVAISNIYISDIRRFYYKDVLT